MFPKWGEKLQGVLIFKSCGKTLLAAFELYEEERPKLFCGWCSDHKRRS